MTAKAATAFENARLLACNDSCGRCGKLKAYPEGVALYEEPYCEGVWLCEECYPEVEAEDDDEDWHSLSLPDCL